MPASPTEVAAGVHRFSDGLANWYAIEYDGGFVLVDSGWPRSTAVLAGGLRALGSEPGAVRALLLTHGHVDHMGGAVAGRAAGRARLRAPRRARTGEGDAARHALAGAAARPLAAHGAHLRGRRLPPRPAIAARTAGAT